MAISSLKFRIEGDATSGLRAITDLRREAKTLGSDLQKSIGDKLKATFSVVAVEEMVRRTGEWALELHKTAQGLGMTGESLQTLRIMADKAGVPIEKLFNFYSKLEAAALKAANGNTKMRESFKALGVDVNRLKGEGRYTSQELFQQTLKGAHGGQGGGAIQEIYGTRNARQIGMLARETKGMSPSEYQAAHASQIVGEEDTLAIARGWDQVKDDLKALVVTLAPVIRVIVTIIDGFAKMVSGVVGELGNIFTGVKLGIKAALPKWLGGSDKAGAEFAQWGREREVRNKASARAAGNFLPGVASMGQWQPFGQNGGTEAERQAAGGMEGMLTAATFGVGGAAKTLGLAGKSGKVAKGLEGLTPFDARIMIQGANPAAVSEAIGNLKGIQTVAGPGILPKMLTGMPAERWKPLDGGLSGRRVFGRRVLGANEVRKVGLAGSALSVGGVGASDINANDMFSMGAEEAPTRQGILSRMGQGGGGAGGPGSGNLAIGGVYGVDIQSKIMNLNEKMVSLLEQIVSNTTPSLGDIGDSEESAGM
jgi:hypothetical protein